MQQPGSLSIDRDCTDEKLFQRPSRREWLKRSMLLCAPAAGVACAHKMPRVVYVDSNDASHGPEEQAIGTIRAELAGHDIGLDVYSLDGGRNPAAIKQAAESVAGILRARKPDVILVSGADAMRHLVIPYLREGPAPVLFRNIEWTVDPYEIPNRRVTGILDIPPVAEAIKLVKAGAPAVKELFVLSGNRTIDRAKERFLEPIYWEAGLSTTYGLVSDFDHWSRAFTWANRHADVIFFVNHDAIRGWNEAAALEHIRERIQVPVFCCDTAMIRYAVVGSARAAGESAQWMARQALRLVSGTKVEDIPMARTTQSDALGNSELAARIGFPLPPGAKLYPSVD